MVRQISAIKVALTPCKISPITKRIFKEAPAPAKEPEVEVAIMDQQKPEPPPAYNEDFYEGFVRRMFEENPQIDKRQLVSKILSHLQQQDYSFLQRQINEQHQLYEEEEDDFVAKETEKEQRHTLMHFEEEEEKPEAPVDVEQILMVNKSFDIIQHLKGAKKHEQIAGLISSLG